MNGTIPWARELATTAQAFGDLVCVHDGIGTLTFQNGAFFVKYYDEVLPVAPDTYALIFEGALAALSAALSWDPAPWCPVIF